MLIGLVGFQGSGKNTVAKILEEEYNFKQVSFASKLKDIVAILFNWPRDLLEGITEESRIFRETKDDYWSDVFKIDITPRYVLKYIGTDTLRQYLHDDIWIHALFADLDFSENIVISDVRFRNEILAIRNKDGVIVRICRGDDPIWVNTLSQILEPDERDNYMMPFGIHKSEYDWILPSYDTTIYNDREVDDLRLLVKSCLDDLKLKLDTSAKWSKT